jgi:hypothetical protein
MGFIYKNLFVDNIAALKALTDTSTPKRVDEVFLGIENNGEGFPGWYKYFASSTTPESLPGIVSPNDGVGRWFSFSGTGSGEDGLPGQSAFTTTAADYTQPEVGNNVTVSVANTSWMAIAQTIFISGGGTYTVASIPSNTSVSLTNLYATNTPVNSTIPSLRMVVSSGIKGEDGEPGMDGNPGESAYTLTTAGYTQPPVGDSVTVAVESTAWMATGQSLFISTAGTYMVGAIASPTSVSLTNLYTDNATPGSTIASSQMVVASGIKGDIGATGTVNASTAIVLNPAETPPSTGANEVDIFANADNEINYREPDDGDIYEVGDRTVPSKLFLISLLS